MKKAPQQKSVIEKQLLLAELIQNELKKKPRIYNAFSV
jgi:hypothetical protein